MMTLNADGFRGYSETCAAIDALKAAGFESGITVGGLWVLLDPVTQGATVKSIVESHGGILCAETLAMGMSTKNYSTAQMAAMIDRDDAIRGIK